jgi:hypothetical protein
MIIRRLLPALAFTGTLAAQTFIQMSDPQFGMYTKNEGFAHENCEFRFRHRHEAQAANAAVKKPLATAKSQKAKKKRSA